MTFGNTTREPVDDWIGSGIAETVTADLRGARGVTIIGRTQVHDAIKHLSGPSLERVAEHQAIEIGRRLGASYIIGGAYQRLGSADPHHRGARRRARRRRWCARSRSTARSTICSRCRIASSRR